MSSNREDITTIRAVNAAAKEEAGDSDDDEPVERVPERGLRSEILAPDEPDLELVIDAGPGYYRYALTDRVTWCSHLATGRSVYASLTGTLMNSLHSIARTSISVLLCKRYGFEKKSEALKSKKRVHVQILMTDADTLEVCRAVSEQGEAILPWLPRPVDREVYRKLFMQLKRFRTSFVLIGKEDERLKSLRSWSNDVLHTNPYDNIIRERVAA